MARIRETQRHRGEGVRSSTVYQYKLYKYNININCLNGNERYKREHCPLPLPRGLRTLPKSNSEEVAGPGVTPRPSASRIPPSYPPPFSDREMGRPPHSDPTPSTGCPHRAQCFTRLLFECSDSAIEIGCSHGREMQRRRDSPQNTQLKRTGASIHIQGFLIPRSTLCLIFSSRPIARSRPWYYFSSLEPINDYVIRLLYTGKSSIGHIQPQVGAQKKNKVWIRAQRDDGKPATSWPE